LGLLCAWVTPPRPLDDMSDTAASFIASAQTGITLVSSSITAGVVKVWLANGTDNQTYKVNVVLTTTAGRVKEVSILIKVKDK